MFRPGRRATTLGHALVTAVAAAGAAAAVADPPATLPHLLVNWPGPAVAMVGYAVLVAWLGYLAVAVLPGLRRAGG